MERWRSFFAQAEADLWTIIHQAIVLAAADFPAEFKHKRCEIAEVLFARRPCPSRSTCSVDATVLSGSVITNATGDGEKKAPYEAFWEEENALRHFDTCQGEVKGVDTLFHGTMSKPSAVERHLRLNNKTVELDTCLHGYNNPKNIPEATPGLAMGSAVLQNVSMIKDQIMGSANQSEDELLRSLRALENLHITVDILKATEIGLEINKFRKHPSGPVRNLVKQLVRTWKGMVDDWVKNAEIPHPLSASGEQEIAIREVSAARHVNLQSEASVQRPLHLPKSSNNSTMGCASTVHTEHAVEEMGSSRVESDELYRPGFMERKANLCGQQVQFSRCMGTPSSNSGLGPGRPLTSTLETERVCRNGPVAREHLKKVEEELRTYAQNFSTVDCKNFEAMKRRLPLEDQHVVRAKKYRDVPPSSSPELSKTGFLSARLPASAKPEACIQRR